MKKKKQAKKAFLGTFWIILAKNSRLLAQFPSKLLNVGAKNEYLKIVQIIVFNSTNTILATKLAADKNVPIQTTSG